MHFVISSFSTTNLLIPDNYWHGLSAHNADTNTQTQTHLAVAVAVAVAIDT